MQMIIKREYSEEDKLTIKKSIRKKYGRIEKIKKVLSVRGCATPSLGEAYLLIRTIEEGENIEEEIVIEDTKVFNVLTARRVELLKYLNTHPSSSLKELSKKIKRDYKNVYDDVFSMERFFILHVVKSGKEKIPVGKISKIEIRI